MKIISKKNCSYLALLVLIFIKVFCFFFDIHISILNLVLFGSLFFVFMLLFPKSFHSRNYQRSLTKTVLILVISYYIFYYLLGLIIGFSYNFYDTSLVGIIYNTFIFILPLLLREKVREKFVRIYKNKKAYIFITIIFICYEVFSSSFFSFEDNEQLLSNLFSIVMPCILENILLTYLASISEVKTIYAYFIPSLVSKYFVPVLPDLDWFYRLLLQIILYICIYSFVSNEYLLKVLRRSPRVEKGQNIFYFLSLSVVILLGLFVAGFFKYQPVAILTYSMDPVFTRGDAVVIKKTDALEKKSLQKDDIIQYKRKDTMVIHRIIDIVDDDGERGYILKGDNNDSKDPFIVYDNQIVGKVTLIIPKVGYPSVWLSEFLHSNGEAEVEIGR